MVGDSDYTVRPEPGSEDILMGSTIGIQALGSEQVGVSGRSSGSAAVSPQEREDIEKRDREIEEKEKGISEEGVV